MLKKIKKVLISQPEPKTGKSHLLDLAEKYNLKLDFHKFIKIEGATSIEYRQSKVKILEHTGVIFSSRIAIDHFFRICEEARVNVPDTMKYFCTSENIALYLQKYIVYRKRKIFFGRKTIDDLVDILKVKHTKGKLLLTMSDTTLEKFMTKLDAAKIKYSHFAMYNTVSCDLKDEVDVMDNNFDLLVFFTPTGIKSLYDNFPDFKQNESLIAAFGKGTQKAAEEYGLRLDIIAPTHEFPSMTMAIEKYIVDMIKANRKR